MTAPFVVFSLPRSRSAWLSVFLGSPERPCGHDIGPTLSRPEEFAERLRGELAGTCETGAAFAWRAILNMLPEAAFVVIKRRPEHVIRSLEAFGILGQEGEMWARAAQLDEIAALPMTLTLDFDELRSASACAELYRFCLGREMPLAWWAHLDPINIQVDMRRQLELLAARRPQIDAVKAAARELSRG